MFLQAHCLVWNKFGLSRKHDLLGLSVPPCLNSVLDTSLAEAQDLQDSVLTQGAINTTWEGGDKGPRQMLMVLSIFSAAAHVLLSHQPSRTKLKFKGEITKHLKIVTLSIKSSMGFFEPRPCGLHGLHPHKARAFSELGPRSLTERHPLFCRSVETCWWADAATEFLGPTEVKCPCQDSQ